MRRLIAALASAGVLASLALTATAAQAATTTMTPTIALTRNTVIAVCEGGLVENPIQVTVTYPDGTGTPINRFAVFADRADVTALLPAAVDTDTTVSLHNPVFGIPARFWVEAFDNGKFLGSTKVIGCHVKKPKPPCRAFHAHGNAVICVTGRKS